MVYDGRPSRGCHTCRKRRVKCDTARPVCAQCTRSQRECLGYRDESELVFRNETPVTTLRVKRFENRKNSIERKGSVPTSDEKSESDSSYVDSLGLTWKAPSKLSIPAGLNYPIDVITVNGLFENFVLSPRHPACSSGHLKFLPRMYQNAPVDSPLTLSTTAMAFAARTLFGMGHRQYTDPAWRTYGRAIQSLNESLRDPIQARKNETLMATMVLGVIESLLATPAPKYARSNHIDGAIALLRLRGKELMKDEISEALHLTVQTHMMLDRIQQAKPADAIFYYERSGWQPRLNRNMQSVNTKLTHHMILVPALRRKAIQLLAERRTASSRAKVEEFAQECSEFDVMLASWPATIPQDWHYSTIAKQEDDEMGGDYENAELFPGNVDIYHDGWVACVWNSWRCSRMFVNAIVLKCIVYLASSTTNLEEHPEYVTAKGRLQEMVDGVSSSVPFHIGYSPPEAGKRSSSILDPLRHLTALEPKAIPTYFLLWPLFVARSAITTSPEQQKWLRGRMMAILTRFGTIQAKSLVDIGDTDRKRPLFADRWDGSMFENIFESSNMYASGGI